MEEAVRRLLRSRFPDPENGSERMIKAAAIAGLVTGISLSCCLLARGCPARADVSALTSAGGTPGITLSPSWSRVMPGEACTLLVMIDDAVDSISCSECVLSFDPAHVSCTFAMEGELYANSSFSTFFDWFITGDDTVTASLCPLGYRSFVLTPGGLFAFIFEGLVEGHSPVRIEKMRVLDPDRLELEPVTGEEAYIVVSTTTGDETPPAAGISMSCHPNPFNPAATIRIEGGMAGSADLELGVYDPAGRLVSPLYDGPLGSGVSEYCWDGRSGEGRAARSGVYFAVARIDGRIITRKLVLLR